MPDKFRPYKPRKGAKCRGCGVLLDPEKQAICCRYWCSTACYANYPHPTVRNRQKEADYLATVPLPPTPPTGPPAPVHPIDVPRRERCYEVVLTFADGVEMVRTLKAETPEDADREGLEFAEEVWNRTGGRRAPRVWRIRQVEIRVRKHWVRIYLGGTKYRLELVPVVPTGPVMESVNGRAIEG